jgi:hypothetical protein
MPLRIIADYRELLIDIFFAIIITIGLERFLYDFLFTNLYRLVSFDVPSLANLFSVSETLVDTFFFFAAYFWVISHWIFYHELIKKYPYYNPWKFFVDITLFSIMFVIINASYSAYNIEITPLFVFLVVIWYFFACLWHVSDRNLRPIGRYVYPHIARLLTFAGILILLYDPLSLNHVIPSYQEYIMVVMIMAMIAWNVYRLSKFMKVDSREYKCDYISGFPGWDSPCNEGRLVLDKNPMKYRIGNKKQDTIAFYTKDNTDRIVILAERVSETTIITLENKKYANDLLLVIEYSDEEGKKIELVLDLDDQTIIGVQKAIKGMCKNNKRICMPNPDNGNIICRYIL